MNYKEAEKLAKDYDKNLLATDPRFNLNVSILHEDSSEFKWKRAFVLQKDQFVFIFTEHFGHHVFDNDDLLSIRQYETKYVAIQKFDL